MIKKIFFYVLSFFFLIFFILVLDLLLSNTFIKQNHCVNYSEFYYELKKNCKGKYRFKSSFPLIRTYTDELGLRVGKNSKIRNKENKNLFIFGDSFTYGVGIKYEQTFVGRIANDLNDYNVYNFGVGSYSPSVYLYKLKKILDRNIKPEKVLIFLDLTDVIDESTRWKYDKTNNKVFLNTNRLYKYENTKKNNFKENNFKLLKNLSSYLNYHFRVLRSNVKLNLNNEYKVKTSIQGNFTYTPSSNLDKRFWKKNSFKNGLATIEDRLNEIKNISKSEDFELIIVVYPWAETLEFGQNEFSWSNYAKSLCKDNTCKIIDAIPDFINYKKNNKNWVTNLYFSNDEHFNTKGAELLYNIIMKNLN